MNDKNLFTKTEEGLYGELPRLIAADVVKTNVEGRITEHPFGVEYDRVIRVYNDAEARKKDPYYVAPAIMEIAEQLAGISSFKEGRHTHDGPPNVQNIAARIASLPVPWDAVIDEPANLPKAVLHEAIQRHGLARPRPYKHEALLERARLHKTPPREYVGTTMLMEFGKFLEHCDFSTDELRKNRLTVWRIATPQSFRHAFEGLFREVGIENFRAFMELRRGVKQANFDAIVSGSDMPPRTHALLTADLAAFVGWENIGAESVTLRIVELQKRWQG